MFLKKTYEYNAQQFRLHASYFQNVISYNSNVIDSDQFHISIILELHYQTKFNCIF